MQENTTTTATPILEKFRELARRAHMGTSFDPKQRAEQYVNTYSRQLAADMAEVEKLGGDPEDYRTRYEAKFSAWMSAKSRCISSMITGPAKFPTRRAEKANQSEHNRYQEFCQFREKYVARIRSEKARAARQEKVAALQSAGEMPADTETVHMDGTRILENHAADRLQIFFPGKPEQTMIQKLKSRGFKWSPSNGCWQRQLTDNARFAAKQILN